MNLEQKIVNKITKKLFGYIQSPDSFKKMFERRFWYYISKIFNIGKCVECGKLTKEQNQFADDAEQDEEGKWQASSVYSAYCHEGCFENIQDSAC